MMDFSEEAALNRRVDRGEATLQQVQGNVTVLLESQSSMRREMNARFDRMDTKVDELRQEMRAGMDGLRQEMRADMGGLRQEMRADMDGLRQQMRVNHEGIMAVLTELVGRRA